MPAEQGESQEADALLPKDGAMGVPPAISTTKRPPLFVPQSGELGSRSSLTNTTSRASRASLTDLFAGKKPSAAISTSWSPLLSRPSQSPRPSETPSSATLAPAGVGSILTD